jgi:stage V sporulation protein SpoVS
MKPIIAMADDTTEALAVKVRDMLYAEKQTEVYAMGPNGLHQAIKALAVVNLKFREEGSSIAFLPEIESKKQVKSEDLIIKLMVFQKPNEL